MTLLSRAALFAVLTAGILGLSGVSVPTIAAQAANEAIGADAAPQPYITPVLTFDPAPVAAPSPIATPDQNDDEHYDSLAAAVAAQATPSDPSAELRCLAGAIYYEAKSEPLAGQLAVAEVIINRAKSGRFPKSLCGVITQAGQFSFVRGNAVPAINPSLQQWKTAVAIAQVALGEDWESPATEAMFFHARRVRPSWSKTRVASIGNHIFYR